MRDEPVRERNHGQVPGGKKTLLEQVLVLFMVLVAAGCSGGQATDQCSLADSDIVLPADRHPHQVTNEWWYYTGHLWDAQQNRYGYEVSFFQSFVGEQVGYVAHFALSDPRQGRHLYGQRIILPDAGAGELDLDVNGWRLWSEGDSYRVDIAAGDIGARLTITGQKPPVLHNGNGVIDMGSGDWSYYYSETRQQVSGNLVLDGNDVAAQGYGWHDHQWGDFDAFGSDGWDWFSLQFDDNTELMMFILHTKDAGAQLTGCTFVDEQGCAHDLEQFELQSLRTWHSPHTGGDYPLDWTLSVPGAELDVEITVTFDDQEMDTRATTLNTYWEGEVTASGTRAGKPVAGLGYVELAGYGPWGP